MRPKGILRGTKNADLADTDVAYAERYNNVLNEGVALQRVSSASRAYRAALARRAIQDSGLLLAAKSVEVDKYEVNEAVLRRKDEEIAELRKEVQSLKSTIAASVGKSVSKPSGVTLLDMSVRMDGRTDSDISRLSDDSPPRSLNCSNRSTEGSGITDADQRGRRVLPQKTAKIVEKSVVARDIAIAALDVASDWLYFSLAFARGVGGNDRDDDDVRLFALFRSSVLAVSILGTALSILLAWASFVRLQGQSKVLCLTVPRLSLALVLLHHAPMFCLTTFADATFAEENYTVAGLFNICMSMVALVNALGTTRCGERFCATCEDGGCSGCGGCGESWSGRDSGSNDIKLANKDEERDTAPDWDEKTVAIDYTSMS